MVGRIVSTIRFIKKRASKELGTSLHFHINESSILEDNHCEKKFKNIHSDTASNFCLIDYEKEALKVDPFLEVKVLMISHF